MRVPITLQQTWPIGETIISLPVPLADPPGWIMLYASRNSWPVAARVEIALEFFDNDDSKWKPIVQINTVGGTIRDRHGNIIPDSYAGSRKRDPNTNLAVPYFRHTWPRDLITRIPNTRLRVNTTRVINSLIELDW